MTGFLQRSAESIIVQCRPCGDDVLSRRPGRVPGRIEIFMSEPSEGVFVGGALGSAALRCGAIAPVDRESSVTPTQLSPRRPLLERSVLSKSDDATLACALAAGNPAATHVALERFGPLVQRVVQRSLRSFNDIDDLAQEVFVNLLENASTLRDPGALRAYILSTTNFKIRGELRKRRCRRAMLAEAAHEPIRVVNSDSDARQALSALQRILVGLSSQDRTLFTLRFVDRRRLSEVADTLHLSLSTVKRRISRLWRRFSRSAARDPHLADYLAGSHPRLTLCGHQKLTHPPGSAAFVATRN
jgi:RNA polymerase sigma-70 factor (ECF subfamily)